MDDPTRERLIDQIQTTNNYVITRRVMLKKACDLLDVSAEDADAIYHLVEALRFHQGILKTQLATFEALFGEKATHG